MAWTAPKVFAVGEVLTASTMNAQVSNNFAALSPIGSYLFAHRTPTRVETTINGAWLECNGAAVSRTTYSTLFSLVSTSYGAGDGSTTFGIPDLAGRMLVAASGAGGHSDVTSLGGNDGTALANRRPRHRHALLFDPGHSHGAGTGALDGGGFGTWQNGSSVGGPGGRGTQASGINGIQVGNNLSDPLDTPPYLVGGVWLIKYTA